MFKKKGRWYSNISKMYTFNKQHGLRDTVHNDKNVF